MLTGDKIETATCIATSAGFKSKTQQLFFMRDLGNRHEVELRLKEFEYKTNTLLMIDGTTLEIILSTPKLEEKFFSVAT